MKEIIGRKSVRTFSGNPLTEIEILMIKNYLGNAKNLVGPNGHRIKVILKEVEGGRSGKIGTYGVIKNAPAFLIAICENDKDALLDCGYVFEKLVLYLESHGLSTCWLGATFSRDELALKTTLGSNEFIPIISPVGRAAKRRRLKDLASRSMMKSDQRLAFNKLFYREDFISAIIDMDERKSLEMVRLAPSASNKQPWRLVVDSENRTHFYLERTPGYDGLGAGYDIQWLDMGIALYHYIITGKKKDYYVEDPKISPKFYQYEYVCSVK